jgi:hypothetical protein
LGLNGREKGITRKFNKELGKKIISELKEFNGKFRI